MNGGHLDIQASVDLVGLKQLQTMLQKYAEILEMMTPKKAEQAERAGPSGVLLKSFGQSRRLQDFVCRVRPTRPRNGLWGPAPFPKALGDGLCIPTPFMDQLRSPPGRNSCGSHSSLVLPELAGG